MADITKIQSTSDSIQYASGARYLTHTPNNTTTFLRGDNNWSNTITGYINSYGLWADQSWNDGNEHQIGVQGNAGKIYMYSSGTTNSNRGIQSCNANGTYKNVLAITPNNDLYLYPHVIQMSDRGVIYSDNYSTGYGGLCLSGGTGYLNGASIALHSCDANSNQGPGNFYISARPTANTWDGQRVLEGQANGLLTWNGGLSINDGPNPGIGTATGHTISTNGNIGCDYECYSNGGFYAGERSSIYRLWNNGWYDVLGSYQNGDTFLRACGGRMHIGFDTTNDILVSTTSGWLCGFWQQGTTMVSRVAGEGLDQDGPALCIREVKECGISQEHSSYAPRIAFHWAGRTGQNIGLDSDGVFRFKWCNSNDKLSMIQADTISGAVWTNYAEMRNIPEAQELLKEKKPLENYEKSKRNIPMAGRCVYEVGDDTMKLSTSRLQRGCKIISDTFGFNIGETKNEKIPIAISGRVLAYCYEGPEEAAKYIGYGVCSGPNGTVSIMTEEEERLYPMQCIGIISSVPTYETWGEENIPIDGRIWIYIK